MQKKKKKKSPRQIDGWNLSHQERLMTVQLIFFASIVEQVYIKAKNYLELAVDWGTKTAGTLYSPAPFHHACFNLSQLLCHSHSPDKQ